MCAHTGAYMLKTPEGLRQKTPKRLTLLLYRRWTFQRFHNCSAHQLTTWLVVTLVPSLCSSKNITKKRRKKNPRNSPKKPTPIHTEPEQTTSMNSMLPRLKTKQIDFLLLLTFQEWSAAAVSHLRAEYVQILKNIRSLQPIIYWALQSQSKATPLTLLSFLDIFVSFLRKSGLSHKGKLSALS